MPLYGKQIMGFQMRTKCKIVLLILISALFANSLTAQISIGIQGGLNSAILNVSNTAPEATFSYNNGFVFGTIINYEINNLFSMQSEPRYIQKGERTQLDLGNIKTDTKLYYNYLELPIYFVTEFTKSRFRPFALAGINLGYLLKVQAESIFNGKEENFDLTEDYKKLDVAIDLGVGLKYEATASTSFLLNARYSYGIYDISKNEGSVNTRGIQLLLGLLYKL